MHRIPPSIILALAIVTLMLIIGVMMQSFYFAYGAIAVLFVPALVIFSTVGTLPATHRQEPVERFAEEFAPEDEEALDVEGSAPRHGLEGAWIGTVRLSGPGGRDGFRLIPIRLALSGSPLRVETLAADVRYETARVTGARILEVSRDQDELLMRVGIEDSDWQVSRDISMTLTRGRLRGDDATESCSIDLGHHRG